MDSIPPELTRSVMKSFRERLQQCVANVGRLMSDLIFKTHLKSVFNVLFRYIFYFFLDDFFHIFIPLRKFGDLYASPCMLFLSSQNGNVSEEIGREYQNRQFMLNNCFSENGAV